MTLEPYPVSLEMIMQKELLPLTGYVHGGCSPIGMKKAFPTFVHNSAMEHEKIYVSAGRVGYQIEIAFGSLFLYNSISLLGF